MKATHTPGPWVAFSNDDPGIVDYVDCLQTHLDRVKVATCGNCSFTYVPMSAAKAAPDLLAALKYLMREANINGLLDVEPSMQQARAAIDKAEGR